MIGSFPFVGGLGTPPFTVLAHFAIRSRLEFLFQPTHHDVQSKRSSTLIVGSSNPTGRKNALTTWDKQTNK
jgi:hypothetical protein